MFGAWKKHGLVSSDVTSGQKFKIVIFIIMSVWIPVKSGKTRETVDQFHANART